MPAAARTIARPAQFDRTSQHRRAMLAKIQIARKDLAMDEDDYRQIVFDKTGRTSLKEASEADLAQVLDVMKAKGFKPIARAGKVAAAQHPMARKARALWISLYHLGEVHNPSEQALEAFACRQLKCDKLVWARQSDAFRLIEALKSWAVRSGWTQHNRATQKPLYPIERQASLCEAILVKLKAAGHVPQDWALHDAMWKLCGEENAREHSWSAEDYARLAQQLGAKLREMGGAT
ncbi:MAG: regulatory protein GemA [Novosphingobium sp.]|uniref:gp16 family protein n=1 Tax=Novosphingobium sp. TaxID=1874826 RepID=UPI0032B92C45